MMQKMAQILHVLNMSLIDNLDLLTVNAYNVDN